MNSQLALFGSEDEPVPKPVLGVHPEGFRYAGELIAPPEERELVDRLRPLPFRDSEFHGYTGKRRVVSYGWQYDFAGRRLTKADDLPQFLLDLRARAASFAGVEATPLQQVLVTEYAPGAGIGWHRDKAEFGDVVGISLLAPCVFRFRRTSDWKRWPY